MSCNKPIEVWQIAEGAPLLFNKPAGRIAKALKIDCGKCLGCRKFYKVDWCTRALCEADLHEANHFATYTYADEHLPENQNLDYRDIQLLHKRIRKATGVAPRFLNVGEYGEKSGRPHWHCIYFGLDIPDLRPVGKGEKGDVLYGSEFLEELWGKGMVRIGEVNAQTCAYTTGYHLKDVESKREGYYDILDIDTGETYHRDLPKMRTSRNPGIGFPWLERYKDDVFPKGYFTQNGKKKPAPAGFLRKLKEVDPEMHKIVSAAKQAIVETEQFQKEHTVQRLKTKENLLQIEEDRRKQLLDPRSDEFWENTRRAIPPIGEAIATAMQKRQAGGPQLAQLIRGYNPR